MAADSNGRHNGLYTYDSFNGSKKSSETHFLWWCAGAHQKLLKDFESEHTKYAGLGGVVLATFALASLSAGYAVFTVFSNWIWATAFAIMWGLIIFNFDRFLVSTMRKYGISTQKQIGMTLPRLLLALLIGFIIARPLELKIFEKEIDVKVVENRHKKILLNDSLLQLENQNVLLTAGQERGRFTGRKLSLEDSLRQLQEAYVTEADGTGGSRQRGIEKLTRLKQEAYLSALQQFSPELKQINSQISYQDSLINNLKANSELKRRQFEATLISDVGFLERNKALSDLSSQESSVFWANLLISLLIILIETGPLLSKLIMNVGPYDIALAKLELTQMAEAENEMRRDQELSVDKLNGLFQKKKEMSVDLIEKLTGLQQKHIDQELERWEKGEKNNNPKTTMNEMIKKLKEQYDFRDENVL